MQLIHISKLPKIWGEAMGLSSELWNIHRGFIHHTRSHPGKTSYVICLPREEAKNPETSEQESAKVFYKGPDSKYFRLCVSYGLYHKYCFMGKQPLTL
jgi:hypothetical protein